MEATPEKTYPYMCTPLHSLGAEKGPISLQIMTTPPGMFVAETPPRDPYPSCIHGNYNHSCCFYYGWIFKSWVTKLMSIPLYAVASEKGGAENVWPPKFTKTL